MLVGTTLQRIGAAALPLGLMAVGAGLQLGGAAAQAPRLAAALLAIRHAVLPAVAIGAGVGAGAAAGAAGRAWWPSPRCPPPSSAYVLAARMGGHGGFVAGLVTLSTLLGMAQRCRCGWRLLALLQRADARSRLRQRPVDVLAHQRARRRRSARAQRRARCAASRARAQRVAQRHRQVAPPALDSRCGGSRCLRCGAGTRPRPRPTAASSVAPASACARVEVGQRRALRVLVPRAGQLAVVAAVDAVADQRRAARRGIGPSCSIVR